MKVPGRGRNPGSRRMLPAADGLRSFSFRSIPPGKESRSMHDFWTGRSQENHQRALSNAQAFLDQEIANHPGVPPPLWAATRRAALEDLNQRRSRCPHEQDLHAFTDGFLTPQLLYRDYDGQTIPTPFRHRLRVHLLEWQMALFYFHLLRLAPEELRRGAAARLL